MNTEIYKLAPQGLWKNFADLNAVPRASKKEERVIAFAKSFGESLGLETKVDHIGNVIIKKPASPGMEDRKTIVMQSHLDMVHQKNSDTQFDFNTEGIRMVIDGDWVKADGTTLGADNGIGVAAIMAILESKSIKHPAIEALFTIDEETGMTGALELKGGLLNGEILLNLDTEDDRELTIGCAGGIDITASGNYDADAYDRASYKGIEIRVSGLTGGHSGMDIHLGRGNANKIMNRILYHLDQYCSIRVENIDGGGLRNAIPRESKAILAISNEEYDKVRDIIGELHDMLMEEYETTDPNLTVSIQDAEIVGSSMNPAFLESALRAIYACPNGIYRMSPDIEDLVQTSNNVARVLFSNGKFEILCLTRSSVDTEKLDLVNAITSTFELMGANIETSGSYPGWTPKPGSEIVELMSQLYVEKYNEKPHVNACHAGLECGILGTNYPQMEMISFGPNIRGAHSPDERVQISSVQKFWDYLMDTLERIPAK
jgi:dipeptidase D